MNNLLRLIVLTTGTLLGCSHDSQRSSQIKNEPINPQPSNMLQPNYFIDSTGIEYPYFSYETKDGEGWAMFIHPMFEAKNRVLSLLYKEGDNIEGLFGKDILGSDFLITNKDGILELEDNAFLLYRPLNANGSWKRKTTHAKENFECKLVLQNSKDYKVKCISSSYTLFFIFNIERGVTSFQDFCLNNDICTYELKSNAGILSPYHLQSMKFEQQMGGSGALTLE